jgi:hypothetical protein
MKALKHIVTLVPALALCLLLPACHHHYHDSEARYPSRHEGKRHQHGKRHYSEPQTSAPSRHSHW